MNTKIVEHIDDVLLSPYFEYALIVIGVIVFASAHY